MHQILIWLESQPSGLEKATLKGCVGRSSPESHPFLEHISCNTTMSFICEEIKRAHSNTISALQASKCHFPGDQPPERYQVPAPQLHLLKTTKYRRLFSRYILAADFPQAFYQNQSNLFSDDILKYDLFYCDILTSHHCALSPKAARALLVFRVSWFPCTIGCVLRIMPILINTLIVSPDLAHNVVEGIVNIDTRFG